MFDFHAMRAATRRYYGADAYAGASSAARHYFISPA